MVSLRFKSPLTAISRNKPTQCSAMNTRTLIVTKRTKNESLFSIQGTDAALPAIINDSIMDSVLGRRGRRTLVSLCIFFDCLKKRAYDLLTKIARAAAVRRPSAMVNSDLLAAKRQASQGSRLPAHILSALRFFAHVYERIACLPHVNGLNLS